MKLSLEPKETFAHRSGHFLRAHPALHGYLIVRGDTDLSAAAVQVSATEIAALNGQIALRATPRRNSTARMC